MALYLYSKATDTALSAFSRNQHQLENCYLKLSTGLRINSAKDDPAGLAISDRLTSEINGYIQGSRNTQDAIALAQTAEGALDETKNMLQRIRTLAIQSANGTNTSYDRQALNAEARQLSQEISRIARKTTYAGSTLLAGVGKGSMLNAKGSISVLVSGHAGDTIEITGLSVGFTLSAMCKQSNIGTAGFVNDVKGYSFDLSSQNSSQTVLGLIDNLIGHVSLVQGNLGGVQTRFESVLRLNDTMRNNTEDARARIRDTDYAHEASELSRLSILQQFMPIMFKQINQNRSLILSLLQ